MLDKELIKLPINFLEKREKYMFSCSSYSQLISIRNQ